MRRNRRKNMYLFLFILLCSLGIGYAFLRTELSINGTADFLDARWDIHFANLVVNPDSVELSTGNSAASISASTTEVTYAVTLNEPGDFYEFTVDAVNAGTMDAMIDTISSKMGGANITNLPNYMEYSVTYSDDVELEPNQYLKAGETETYKVHIGFKKEINASDLTGQVENKTFSFSVTYVQADENAVEPVHPDRSLYGVIKTEAENNGLAREYTGDHKDSFTEPATHKIYYWYATIDDDGLEINNKNNVIFAGHCWQMIRTTDTGGTKILYNGLPNNGKCNNTGNATHIGFSYYNTSAYSPAYAGYMYNPNTLISYEANNPAISNSLFGSSVTYSNGVYTLTNTSTTYDNSHRYTCNNTSGSCSTVRYYYYENHYTQLNDGRNITEALEDMLSADDVNLVDSNLKTFVDNWYQENLIDYTNKLEDTIFCNDRSVSALGGWDPTGESDSTYLTFHGDHFTSGLSCSNVTDQFSLANSKARLTYPVGLLTSNEFYLINSELARATGSEYWMFTPSYFTNNSVSVGYVKSSGRILYSNYLVYSSSGVRPAISLKSGIKYKNGDGSKNDPYVIE